MNIERDHRFDRYVFGADGRYLVYVELILNGWRYGDRRCTKGGR